MLLVFTSNSSVASANEIQGTYQIDFVAINSPAGTPSLTETQARTWVSALDKVYREITGGKITAEFRTLYPAVSTTDRLTSPIGLKTKFPTAAVPKATTAVKSVLVGVISKDSSVGFAGIAVSGGDEILLNGTDGTDFVTASILIHEFGHILSLAHANSVYCPAGVEIINCELTEYGDSSDIMGKYIKSYTSFDARFNAISLVKLGALPSSATVIASNTAEVDLLPLYSTQTGYKLIYIPIYNKMGYAVEYRPATGIDASLAQTRIFTNSNTYYTNTPSHGLQVRFLGSQASPEQKFLPKTDATSNTVFFNSSKTRQGFDAGESLTLPDGSVVRFVSGSGDAAVKVKIERSPDTTSPTISIGELALEETARFPKLKLEYEKLFDDRLVTKLELLVNSTVVTTISNPGIAGTIDYELTSGKNYTYQLVATDAAGNQTKSAVETAAVGCSNEKCYVGATWEVEAPSWRQKLGVGQLQELVGKKWVVRASSAPVNRDGLFTYNLKYSPTKAGKSKFRIYVKPTKNWAAYVGRAFTMQVIG